MAISNSLPGSQAFLGRRAARPLHRPPVHVSSLPACCAVSPPSPDDWGTAVDGMFSIHGLRKWKRCSLCPLLLQGHPHQERVICESHTYCPLLSGLARDPWPGSRTPRPSLCGCEGQDLCALCVWSPSPGRYDRPIVQTEKQMLRDVKCSLGYGKSQGGHWDLHAGLSISKVHAPSARTRKVGWKGDKATSGHSIVRHESQKQGQEFHLLQ